jgi:hypothetical protein
LARIWLPERQFGSKPGLARGDGLPHHVHELRRDGDDLPGRPSAEQLLHPRGRQRQPLHLLGLHGGVDLDPRRERESFVVREDDYIDYLAGIGLNAAIPVLLAAKLRRSHFLFLGYTLEEWSLRVFLRRLWGEERVAYHSWAVQPSPDPVAVEYWRQRGVEAFDVALDEYVAELSKRVEDAIAREPR